MVLKHKQKPITDDRLLLTTKETARLLGYAEQKSTNLLAHKKTKFEDDMS